MHYEKIGCITKSSLRFQSRFFHKTVVIITGLLFRRTVIIFISLPTEMGKSMRFTE